MTLAPLAEINGVLVESGLISLGVVLLLGLIGRHAKRGDLAAWVRLAPPERSPFTELDLAAATLVFFAMPMLLQPMLGDAPPAGRTVTAPAATQVHAPPGAPTTNPAEPSPPSPAQLRSDVASRLLSMMVLLWLGATRFAGRWDRWGLTLGRLPQTAALALIGYLCIWPACAGTVYLTNAVIHWLAPSYQPPEHDAIRLLLEGGGPKWVPVVTVLQAILLAPMVEELFFRGILQAALAGWLRSHWPAIFLSAGLFGLIHYPQIQHMPALAVFALGLGYLYARTGSLTLVMLVHMIFNAKTLIFLAIFGKEPA